MIRPPANPTAGTETEPPTPEHGGRRRLLVALAVTAVAIPLLVLDNLPDDTGSGASSTTQVIPPASAPENRPETGPAKGISVVTSSTTSSTQPIVVTTTTQPG